MRSIRRRLRLLEGYAVGSTALLTIVALAAFRQEPQKTRFTEIDVERINVVEPDGTLRLVLSNRPRSSGPIFKGEPFGYPGGNRPGIVFFNDEGTECGGLVCSGRRGADGKYEATNHFSFDQFDQDQVVYLQYVDENGRRRMGLTIADRADVSIRDLMAERDAIAKMPAGAERDAALRKWEAPRDGVPLSAQRVFVGRDLNRAAVIALSDANGKPRLRLCVDAEGAPRLEFLDASGAVTARLPE